MFLLSFLAFKNSFLSSISFYDTIFLFHELIIFSYSSGSSNYNENGFLIPISTYLCFLGVSLSLSVCLFCSLFFVVKPSLKWLVLGCLVLFKREAFHSRWKPRVGAELVSWCLGGMGEDSGLDVGDPKLAESVSHWSILWVSCLESGSLAASMLKAEQGGEVEGAERGGCARPHHYHHHLHFLQIVTAPAWQWDGARGAVKKSMRW